MEYRTCKVCGEAKEAVQGTWQTAHGRPNGKTCLACVSALSLARYHADPNGKAKNRAYSQKYYADPVKHTKMLDNNKKSKATPTARARHTEAVRKIRSTAAGMAQAIEYSLLWARKNPAKACALTMKRIAAKLKRTPKWADLTKIKAVYADAARLTMLTGTIHAVDHIIPLQGKLISGLHVHNNLQVITRSENSSKGNKWLVE